jgi:hypothetical protein
MTLNVNLPVGTNYRSRIYTDTLTSQQYSGLSGTISNLLTRSISATLANVNRICISNFSGGLANIYNGIKFNVENDIGGLTTDRLLLHSYWNRYYSIGLYKYYCGVVG